mmetsp:Transcript_9337/g.26260  ORF Transcript_9337/g.26260 Transcript_9337/m.26260 type:complete len:202 (-) Transcript_9337:63-668(-)
MTWAPAGCTHSSAADVGLLQRPLYVNRVLGRRDWTLTRVLIFPSPLPRTLTTTRLVRASTQDVTVPTAVEISTVPFSSIKACLNSLTPSGGSVSMLTTPRDIRDWSDAIAVAMLTQTCTPSRKPKSGVALNALVTGKTRAAVSPLPIGMPPLMIGCFARFSPGSAVGLSKTTFLQSATATPSTKLQSRSNRITLLAAICPG